jgi:alkylation response protein AidB-like acyl-CoA dehydrogenase
MISLNSEQKMLVNAVTDIAEREFAENACQWEGNKPWENLQTLADHGFLGVSFSEEFGGGGMSTFDAILVQEAVGRVCPDTAYALPDMNAGRVIEMFGSDEIKERYLPPVIKGEDHIAIGISEPEAGSDVQSMNTEIREEDGGLVLDGEKIWVSGVEEGSAVVVWAKFPEGLGTVVVDTDADGFEVAEHFENMFGHNQSQFFLNDIHVPKKNVLTRGQEAFKELLVSLNWERIGSAALSNATSLCAFDMALDYAQEREQFGQPIGDFQGIEWKLADMAKEIQTSRALVFNAAKRASQANTEPSRLDTSMANLYAAEVLERTASEALQIHGANGFQKGHPMEYLYRFGRSRRIAAGTDEVLKNQVAAALKRNGIPKLGE